MLTKLKAILSAIWSDTKDTWARIKIYVLAIGALVIALEFRKLKEFLITYQGKKEIQQDKKQDAQLADKEKNANDASNALVQEANNLPNQQPPITDDWNKK